MICHSVAFEDEGMSLSNKGLVKLKKTKPDELVVLWISGDREVALKMAFMYTFNSKRFKWGWKNVTLVVWGPSAKLLSEDKELQERIFDMKERGVKLLACKKCSDLYGVSDALRQLGIEVKYVPDQEDLKKCFEFGRQIAAKIKA
jgi:hypothetical protein